MVGAAVENSDIGYNPVARAALKQDPEKAVWVHELTELSLCRRVNTDPF